MPVAICIFLEKAGSSIEVHTPCQNMLGKNSDDLSRAPQYWHYTSLAIALSLLGIDIGLFAFKTCTLNGHVLDVLQYSRHKADIKRPL